MPYIPQNQRNLSNPLNHAGRLHYDISQVIDRYLFHQNAQPRYQQFNDVMGVLACAQAEVYRRLIAPYEDKKIQENGDVFSVPDNNDSDQSFECSADGQDCSSPYCTCKG